MTETDMKAHIKEIWAPPLATAGFKFTWSHFIASVRVIWPSMVLIFLSILGYAWVQISLAFDAAAGRMPDPTVNIVSLAVLIVLMVLLNVKVVSSLILVCAERSTEVHPFAFGRREWRVLGASLLVLAIFIMPIACCVAISLGIGLNVTPDPDLQGAIAVAIMIVLFFLVIAPFATRFWTLSARAALGDGFSPSLAWKDTEGATLRLYGAFLMYLLIAVLIGLVFGVVAALLAMGAAAILTETGGPTIAGFLGAQAVIQFINMFVQIFTICISCFIAYSAYQRALEVRQVRQGSGFNGPSGSAPVKGPEPDRPGGAEIGTGDNAAETIVPEANAGSITTPLEEASDRDIATPEEKPAKTKKNRSIIVEED